MKIMKKTKKLFGVVLAATLSLTLLAGCGGNDAPTTNNDTPTTGTPVSADDFDSSREITVISREDGSGTRGAFVELMGVVDAEENDATYAAAEITNSTSVMMTTVAGNEAAIGYVSLGSLNDSVKAISVDGTACTVENIKDGSYAVARPFNVATREDISEVAQDFISFIMSTEGQNIINEEGYIAVDDAAPEYTASGMSGKITLGGSTSVAPVMEVLAEAYKAHNPDVEVEIQQTGSGAGMTAAIEGIVDIGMASREVKDSEKEQGLTDTTIAMDGIAVIVNQANPITGLTSAQIQQIYLGEVTTWADVQ